MLIRVYRPQIERMLAETEEQGIRELVSVLRNANITGTVVWTCESGRLSM